LSAGSLRALAESLGLNIYLALAEVRENWTTNCDYDDYYGNRRGKYANSDPEPEDLIDTEITLSNWLDDKGKLLTYQDNYVSSDELCWITDSNELDPFESEYEGYMGNYGNTVDYWYHRAAVIMWRKDDHLAIEFDIAPNNVFEELYNITRQDNNQAKLAQNLAVLVPYLQRYIENKHNESDFTNKLFTIAGYINNPQQAYDILAFNNMLALTPLAAASFINLQKIYHSKWCLELLTKWQENSDKHDFYQDFMTIITTLLHEGVDHDISTFLLQYQLQAIYTAPHCQEH
jgi:hypothetical protein